MLHLLHFPLGELQALGVEPLVAALALHHEQVGVVRHLAHAVHRHAVGLELPRRRLVQEPAEVVQVAHDVQRLVGFQRVHVALAVDGVCRRPGTVVSQSFLLTLFTASDFAAARLRYYRGHALQPVSGAGDE